MGIGRLERVAESDGFRVVPETGEEGGRLIAFGILELVEDEKHIRERTPAHVD